MDRNENLWFSDEKVEEDNQDTAATLHQLQILQSLIPNSNKTDARSILEDASDYVQKIQQEMEQIEKELSQRSEDNGSSSRSRSSGSSSAPKILRVVTEKLVESRFVVKISSNKGPGVAAQVQRVLESLELDMEMTSISVQEKTPFEMLTTAIVEVTKETMTEEELHDLITKGAERLGLLVH
ncbi:transcription factor FER-LIKE IRON DEFICIENCY-INDUCED TRANSCRIPTION FACTOR-like [Telopea speciosissima]|uniref:transcription factor FER-LIKE IRON DEFICIENCY-INDUCED TRANSCRIPTION FACTOR-like n=1 Tax=Telopea speciosissima TaxID=54955 RepID=UPI001CC335CB|nr:transcription factor FER-LIKE IRON DEFICIENCY-INDUCED TRANSCRIPTION FACTOR-like [Telopea speciosissima]